MKNLEIERKFLVDREIWSTVAKPDGVLYLQGYLSIDEEKVVRVRVAGNQGWITIKGRSETFSHPEYEYQIPPDDARLLILNYAVSKIEKTRTRVLSGNHTWEVDEFHGENEGLLMAEIELDHADEIFEKPEWLGEEVTADNRYYNAYLSRNPYSQWQLKDAGFMNKKP